MTAPVDDGATTVACRVCGGRAKHRLTTTDRNRMLSDETFAYLACRICGTLYLANVPEDLGRYYPQDYYPLGADGAVDPVERAKVALLSRFAQGGRLVEVGPGGGRFALEAQRSGFDVRAIEMDERACQHLRELGVGTVQSAAPHEVLAEMAPSRAIVLWHVFEHLGDPVALLRAAAANLEPGGVLLLAVPNPAAFQLRVLGPRWPHIDAPRHLQLVPAPTLARLAGEHGLAPLALIGADKAGRGWNLFGWQHVLMGPRRSVARRRATFVIAWLLAETLAAIERHGLRGSTYTAVYRKDEPA